MSKSSDPNGMSSSCLEVRSGGGASERKKGGLYKAKIVPNNVFAQLHGKVIKKVLAQLLSDEAERRALLSDGQFGRRKN